MLRDTIGRVPWLRDDQHCIGLDLQDRFGRFDDHLADLTAQRRRIFFFNKWSPFALATTELHIWLLFAFYGLFYGLTEGVEKALLADIAAPAERGAAFGWYNCAIGLGALLPHRVAQRNVKFVSGIAVVTGFLSWTAMGELWLIATVTYYVADHLGSTSLTLDASGNKIGEMRYCAAPLSFVRVY